MRIFYRLLYDLVCAIGRPFGGIRPLRIYDFLGQRAFGDPQFVWFRDRWGSEFYLSHSYHIDRNILNFGCYDLELHLALEQVVKPGMVCFDVGANLGEMTLHMATLAGSGGAVHAFEPVSAVHARLAKHVQRNHPGNVQIYKLALSNRNGTLEISCAAPDADNQGLASIVNSGEKSLTQREHIEVRTLDDFVAEQGITRIDLMKIDIQGAEMSLLEGGTKVFNELAPDLFMEISPADLKSAGFNSQDLCRKLESFGYTLYQGHDYLGISPLDIGSVTPDFHATNVYCRRRKRGGD